MAPGRGSRRSRADWVRSLFVIGTVFSAGILAVVYVALAFLLPIAAAREA